MLAISLTNCGAKLHLVAIRTSSSVSDRIARLELAKVGLSPVATAALSPRCNIGSGSAEIFLLTM